MKLKAGLITILFLLINAFTLMAGGANPCDADAGDCPLDSGTYILVFAALVFVSFRLYRRPRTGSI